jgi:hypothetical protein
MNTADEVLHLAREMVARNTHTLSVIGARSIVLTKFLDAVLPYLTTSQSVIVSHSFRQGIDEVLALLDDVPVPPEHLATLLEMTSSIQNALNGK